MSNKKDKAFLQAQVYIGTNPHRTLKAPIKEGIENILNFQEKHSTTNL